MLPTKLPEGNSSVCGQATDRAYIILKLFRQLDDEEQIKYLSRLRGNEDTQSRDPALLA